LKRIFTFLLSLLALVVQERTAANLPQVTYTRGLDLSGTLQGAGGIGGLLARSDHSRLNAQPATAFYHSDGNGNVKGSLLTFDTKFPRGQEGAVLGIEYSTLSGQGSGPGA
jgi:hypothetical protein